MLWDTYHKDMPSFIRRIAGTDVMRRLEHVGMNCGCEYTSFPRFAGLKPYSRFTHSIGCALIVWHFTSDVKQSVAALLHDIATPSFAHVVDFLNGDHERQESTEARTVEMIESSSELMPEIRRLGLTIEQVSDYHIYPIADNDTPRLSSDRLEYTLGNIVNYGISSEDDAARFYEGLTVGNNEDGVPELVFRDLQTAFDFGKASLEASAIYVDDADRYAMQMLAELLKKHIERGVLSVEDLYTTEPEVIAMLQADPQAARDWSSFRFLHQMHRGPDSVRGRVIPAKKRYIDPFVAGEGRLSGLSPEYGRRMKSFLSTDFGGIIWGE